MKINKIYNNIWIQSMLAMLNLLAGYRLLIDPGVFANSLFFRAACVSLLLAVLLLAAARGWREHRGVLASSGSAIAVWNHRLARTNVVFFITVAILAALKTVITL